MINSKNTILKHYKEHCDHNRSAETITLCSTTVLDQIVQAHLMVEKKKDNVTQGQIQTTNRV
jgi:hypothetical protein